MIHTLEILGIIILAIYIIWMCVVLSIMAVAFLTNRW